MKALIALLVVMAGLVALSPAQGSPRPHSYGNFGTNGRHNSVGSDISISAVSVLLPQDPNVLYKLEVFNGCFRWYVLTLLVPILGHSESKLFPSLLYLHHGHGRS